MGTKVFVGGIAWKTNDDSLRNAFERYGEVQEAKVILDRETGRSRGFGFVTFGSNDEAENAIRGMDGVELDGRTIKVNLAEDKRGDGGGAPRRPSGPGGGNYR